MNPVGKFITNVLVGANLATVAAMLVSGYSDHLHPEQFSLLAVSGIVFPFLVVVNLAFVVIWVFVGWRKLWIPVVGLTLAYVPIRIYFPLNPQTEPPDDAIKVLSYNVLGFSGNHIYDNGTDTICSYLEQQQADIVCLQEDQEGRYVTRKRMEELFAHNQVVSIESEKSKGKCSVGVHSRFPILHHETIDSASSTGSGGAAAFWLKNGADTIAVIVCHLESFHFDEGDRERYKQMLKGEMGRDSVKNETHFIVSKLRKTQKEHAPQAEAIADYISKLPPHYPVIVCGDLNDTPISYARRTIATGLTDCFVEAGRGLGLSYNQKGFNFRIDHVMCSAHFKPVRCQIDSKMDASDHYPVLTWLKMVDNH